MSDAQKTSLKEQATIATPPSDSDDDKPLSKRTDGVMSDISSLNSIKVLDPPDEIRKNLDDEEN